VEEVMFGRTARLLGMVVTAVEAVGEEVAWSPWLRMSGMARFLGTAVKAEQTAQFLIFSMRRKSEVLAWRSEALAWRHTRRT
jgi:hypothetical protein